MIISLVVAASDNNTIGLKGNLLWRLPKDMEFFKNITSGHYILMGRKTWESLPASFKPLKDRINVVVTRNSDFKAEGAVVVNNADDGIKLARSAGEKELMVIGGGEIYRETLAKAHRIYITRVHHEFKDADTFFPELSAKEWKQVSIEKHLADARHKYDFDFVVMERKTHH